MSGEGMRVVYGPQVVKGTDLATGRPVWFAASSVISIDELEACSMVHFGGWRVMLKEPAEEIAKQVWPSLAEDGAADRNSA